MTQFTLGIDFGTSTTAVSIRQPNSPPIPLSIGKDNRSTFMPSVVAFQRHANNVLIGEDALNATGASFVIRSVKRCFGCNGTLCQTANKISQTGCIGNGQIKIPDSDTPLDPGDIARLIVKEALERAIKAATQIGIDLRSEEVTLAEEVNFGCGAAFNLPQRQILMNQIAGELGFKAVTLEHIVEEPIAAGISYAKLVGLNKGQILIYDFGGGTFDTAILEVDRDRITILAANGEPWLGGDDIDQLVYGYFIKSIARELKVRSIKVEEKLDTLDQQSLRRLATEAKETLSTRDNFEDTLISTDLGMLFLDLSRSDLENLVLTSKVRGQNLIERSLSCVLSTWRTAQTFKLAQQNDTVDVSRLMKQKLEDIPKTIDYVVLVGGATKMPLVRQRIEGIFGSERVVTQDVIDPVDAVSVGLAYPRQLEQFSLLRPPYSIELLLTDNLCSRKPTILTLYRAYDKLEYFGNWATNHRFIYASPRQRSERKYKHVRLRFTGAGLKKPKSYDLDHYTGEGDFFVVLDMVGRFWLNNTSVNLNSDDESPRVPITHPVQDEILEAQKRRQAANKPKTDSKKEIQSLFREN